MPSTKANCSQPHSLLCALRPTPSCKTPACTCQMLRTPLAGPTILKEHSTRDSCCCSTQTAHDPLLHNKSNRHPQTLSAAADTASNATAATQCCCAGCHAALFLLLEPHTHMRLCSHTRVGMHRHVSARSHEPAPPHGWLQHKHVSTNTRLGSHTPLTQLMS